MTASRKSVSVRVRATVIVPMFATVLAGWAVDASAQSRYVFVNGQRMSDSQIAVLAQRQCAYIPNGSYWLNTRTGAWGYAGNPQVQGVIGDGCRSSAGPGGGENHDGTHGPYATVRRAQEVADGYRRRGLHAAAFHNGDGFYVRVSR